MKFRRFRALASAALMLVSAGSARAQVRSTHVSLDRTSLDAARRLTAEAGVERIEGFAVVEAPHGFTAVAFLSDPSSDGQLVIRVSADGRRWSEERTLPDEPPNGLLDERGGAAPFPGDRVSALCFPRNPARFVAFQFRGATRQPSRVTAHFIDSPAGRLRSRSDVDAPPSHPLKPALVRRIEWGARAPKYAYTLTSARLLAIHHTAGVTDGLVSTLEECAAQARAIQAFHQDSRGWNDIGYSYLICPTGDVLQAREDDDDATDIWGAHDGFNDGSMSVSLLGYYHPPYNQLPSPAMVDALIGVLTWMSAIRGIDPLGDSLYPAFGSVVSNVYGHREVRATDCPGDIVFAMKGAVRVAVAERLAAFANPAPTVRRR